LILSKFFIQPPETPFSNILNKNKQNAIIAHIMEIDKIRHSLAHLTAIAILDLYPNTKLTIGPVIENGFYYDFDLPEGVSISPDNFKKIEKEIKKLISKKLDFTREEISADEAKKIFKDNEYKLELIDEIGENISIYKTGDFIDPCKGPHVSNTSEINPDAFALTHTAGAYWRGDEKNKMLTRVYGVAFENKEDLEIYLEQQEEAKKRDHRKLGKELDLFTFSPLVGSGLPMFTPKGASMRNAIVHKIHSIQKKFDYQNVWIPHITKKKLYETSGHWEKFGEELFHVKGQKEEEFVMKPMNCPHHTQIYASSPKSYKDLPVRFTEVTTNYRDEQTGELLGLSRVRSLTQDDGHVFCTIDQTEEEVRNIISVIKEFYESLDMFKSGDYWVSLSVRDPDTPEKYLGEEKNWSKAEKTLENALKKANLPYKKVEGEAVFYGPKIDFMFNDSLGREWQLATIQLDFVMPERFKLSYIDKDSNKQTPVMIHRAIAGSLERFLSVIIEHFAGAFPFWLSPVQVKIIPIGEMQKEYAEDISNRLRDADIRVELDKSDETLGKKIRNAKLEKVPYYLVIGEKEASSKTVTVESRDDEKIGEQTIDKFIEFIENKVKAKK